MIAAESDVKSKLNLAQNLNFSPKKLEKVELFINEVLSYNKKYCKNIYAILQAKGMVIFPKTISVAI